MSGVTITPSSRSGPPGNAIGTRPTIYKAGRYGVGPATTNILADLGYQIDISIVPHSTYEADGGPDFRGCLDRPDLPAPKLPWPPSCPQ